MKVFFSQINKVLLSIYYVAHITLGTEETSGDDYRAPSPEL